MAKSHLSRPGIYCIRNLISGRRYVGSSVNIKDRWKSHRHNLREGRHPGKAMQNSWLKHGEAAFEFSVLEFIEQVEDLIQAEQRWIDHFDATNPHSGFNVSPTAGNCLGVRHSDDTKAKLSMRRKGVPKSPEHRKAIGDAHRGRTIPEERRQRVAEGVRRYFAEHPEARERMREVGHRNGLLTKGRKLSPEIRKAYSDQKTGDPRYAEIARTNLGKMTDEQRAIGRAKSGMKPGTAMHDRRSLSFEQAEEIRTLRMEGWIYDRLVERFGIDRCSLWNIVNHRTYQKP